MYVCSKGREGRRGEGGRGEGEGRERGGGREKGGKEGRGRERGGGREEGRRGTYRVDRRGISEKESSITMHGLSDPASSQSHSEFIEKERK